jgi:hypothetical protein
MLRSMPHEALVVTTGERLNGRLRSQISRYIPAVLATTSLGLFVASWFGPWTEAIPKPSPPTWIYEDPYVLYGRATSPSIAFIMLSVIVVLGAIAVWVRPTWVAASSLVAGLIGIAVIAGGQARIGPQAKALWRVAPLGNYVWLPHIALSGWLAMLAVVLLSIASLYRLSPYFSNSFNRQSETV